MRSIVRGVVALFAAILMMDVAKAAPTIVSPADYSAVATLTPTMKGYIYASDFLNTTSPYFNVASTDDNPNERRKGYLNEYFYRNSVPVTLSWSGTTGECIVKLWRTKKDTENTPFYNKKVSGTSIKFYNLEVGRNYTWKVIDSNGNSVVGHFYTEATAPRIIRGRRDGQTEGADCSNGRDIGGWRTTDGKVVKQGLIYRSQQLEYCSTGNGDKTYETMSMLYDTLGVRLDLDLRTITNVKSFENWKAAWNNNKPFDDYLKKSGIGPNVVRFVIENETLGLGPENNPRKIDGKSGIKFPDHKYFVQQMTASDKIDGKTTTYTQTADQNKIAVWVAFNRLYQSVVEDKEPAIFHCSHGKDRTGTLALLLHGLLGVSVDDAKRDYATAWFSNQDETMTFSSINSVITSLKAYDSGNNFQKGCEAYLKECATKASDSSGVAKISAFKNAMLEDIEASDGDEVAPEPEEDTFEYTNYYWRRNAGGGTWTSSTGYWYKHPSNDDKYAGGVYPDSYNACAYLMPTKDKPYATPGASKYRLGKLILDASNVSGDDRLSTSTLQPYFSNEGHSVSDRSIIELRNGVCEFENMDVYLTVWGKTKYDSESARTSVFNGTAAVEVWANATMRVTDFISVSPSKTYLKFPSDNCANARFEAFEHGDTSYPYNSIGWFTGGSADTKQYIKVQGAYPLKFSASGKTSGIAGALGLEFEFGENNKTTTAAMLQVAGILNINAGSTITVNAGGKGAGTYKLISAGTLNENANLNLRSNYTVTNCKSGYYGVIEKSGNSINLKIQEGIPPAEDEGFIDTETEGDWGYRLKVGNEVILAFTNHAKVVNWKVPANIVNAKFLVVGGGGGGGADTCTSDAYSGGGGGGGGGVVTGLVSFAENSYVTITVGNGGAGGTEGTMYNSQYGASASGGNSMFITSDGYRATAFGGGGSGGLSGGDEDRTTVESGPAGGSTAGGRAKSDANKNTFAGPVATATKGEVVGITVYGAMGNNGGESTGNYAGAGGGGAMGKGDDTTGDAANGGPGYESNITGSRAVYGSGGGGSVITGVGGLGGEGAGNGNIAADASGSDGLANQGGGGGAGGRGDKTSVTKGGNGGSGIVVLRYVDPDYSDPYVVAVPKAVTGLVYDGTVKTGVEGGTGYTLTANTATDAGSYTATATLAEGYTWSDGSTATQTITWSIAKATNVWTTEPNITPASWIVGNTAGKLTTGVAKFGVVTATMNGVAFSGTLPTAVGTYTIVYTVAEDVTNYTGLTKTVSFEITEVPVINPTEYGAADTAASTYTWIGYTGPWMYTTNWTASAGATYGVPANGTHSTVVFPASLENAFTCTLNETLSVRVLAFDSPNLNLVLDNAALTATSRVNPSGYGAYYIGTNENANASIEFKGASAALVATGNSGACKFGSAESETDEVRCTVKFEVPATGWENSARIRATGSDSSVYFYHDSKLVIDATRLGVPGADESKKVLLAEATNRLTLWGDVVISCAQGAKGSVEVVNKQLVLTVVADPNVQPEEPVLVAVDAPVAVTGLVYTGAELTGVAAANGYTLTANTATDAGNYTAIATLAEGYKWSDGTTEPKTITWSIAKATNEWTTEPKIEPATWTEGSAGTYTAGVAKGGTGVVVTITKDGATTNASLDNLNSWTAGSYSITFTVDESKNYRSLSKEVTVTVNVPENEPGDDNFVSPIPSIPEEWGYVKTGLGDLKNEVAVVFTNENADAMTWTVPYKLDNVQFLVVGGGGAGGGAASYNANGDVHNGSRGGAGGGGGGVVTGLVNFVQGSEISIKVGNGGTGGKYSNSYSDGTGCATALAGFSLVKVGEVEYVKAGGGGSDTGYNTKGGQGGSNSGSRKTTVMDLAVDEFFYVDSTFIKEFKTFGHKGGKGNYESVTFSAGGGGGAMGDGADGTKDTYNAGNGGAGLSSDITGVTVIYGAGGGGGAGRNGNGGTGGAGANNSGAGNGGSKPATTSYSSIKNNGSSALANQGGGGGGAGYRGDGGNGGSGIVVFRYAIKPIVGGNMVNPDTVLDTARTSKPILYPSEPTIGKNAGGEPTITFAGVTVTAKKYYDISVSKNSDGTYIAKFALNESARPVVNKTALDKDDAIVVTDDAVALGVTNAKVGLYYSVEAYSDPTCAGDPIIATTPSKADKETLNLTLSKPKVEDKTLDAAFFKIVVTD